jgi:RNA polymerase sigma factor (sigma-70 family)
VETSSARAADGARLEAQAQALHLCLAHLAGRAVRARVELEDLAQEVFLRALADPSGLPASEPGENALRRWLAHLARNVVVDVARAARAAKRDGQREQRLERSSWSRSGAVEPARSGPGPATQAAGRDELSSLLAAFARLAPDHRRVLGLRQFEGLDARETGRRMGRGESAVHSLYRRALAAWAAQCERPPAENPAGARRIGAPSAPESP